MKTSSEPAGSDMDTLTLLPISAGKIPEFHFKQPVGYGVSDSPM